MRIAIVDFGGYGFIAQLARALAAHGHAVLFTCMGDFQGPKSGLGKRDNDPATLDITPVYLGEPFQKYSFVRRRRQEIRMGKAFARLVGEFRPDVVVSANMPLETLLAFRAGMARSPAAFVYWVHDIVSLAMKAILTNKLGFPAGWRRRITRGGNTAFYAAAMRWLPSRTIFSSFSPASIARRRMSS